MQIEAKICYKFCLLKAVFHDFFRYFSIATSIAFLISPICRSILLSSCSILLSSSLANSSNVGDATSSNPSSLTPRSTLSCWSFKLPEIESGMVNDDVFTEDATPIDFKKFFVGVGVRMLCWDDEGDETGVMVVLFETLVTDRIAMLLADVSGTAISRGLCIVLI